MKARVVCFITTISLILSLCAGCTGGKNANDTSGSVSEHSQGEIYYRSVDMTYSEPGKDPDIYTVMDVTVDGNTEYSFQNDISDTRRRECIAVTEKLFKYLDIYTETEIYVFSEADEGFRFVSGNKAYVCLQDFKSIDYIADILPAVFGGYCNYGLVYGYAVYLYEQLFGAAEGYFSPRFDADWQYYDINLLCFDTDFASAEDIENARNIACDFVKKYISENGIKAFNKLLVSSGDTAENGTFLLALSEYYGENGVYPTLSGILYGYAVYLYEQLFGAAEGYFSPRFDADWQYYDINLLCFDTDFASAEDIENARNIACDFVKKYISENGIKAFNKLLVSSGDTAENGTFLLALSEYYGENGVYPTLSGILYGYGGKYYDYYAACKYAVFCVKNDWTDRLQERAPNAYDGFLNRDYAKTREYFETTETELGNIRDEMGLEPYKEGLRIIFTDVQNFYKEDYCIFVSSHANLIQLYIISLFSDVEMEYWKKVGLSANYDRNNDIYSNHALNEYYKNRGNGPTWAFANEFVEKTGRDIDVSTDIYELQNIVVYYYGSYEPEEGGDSAASFTHYLISLFGKDDVKEYLLGKKELSSFTDKTFDTLKAEWKEYLETNYSEYSKYK